MVESGCRRPVLVVGAAITLTWVLGWVVWSCSAVCGSLRMASSAPLTTRVATTVAIANPAAMFLL